MILSEAIRQEIGVIGASVTMCIASTDYLFVGKASAMFATSTCQYHPLLLTVRSAILQLICGVRPWSQVHILVVLGMWS